MLCLTLRYKTIPILLLLLPNALLLHFANGKLEHRSQAPELLTTEKVRSKEVATVNVSHELGTLLRELPRGLIAKIEINAWTTTIRKL